MVVLFGEVTLLFFFSFLSPAEFRLGADSIRRLRVNFIVQNREPCKDNSWVLVYSAGYYVWQIIGRKVFYGQSLLVETGAPEYDWAQMNELKGLGNGA